MSRDFPFDTLGPIVGYRMWRVTADGLASPTKRTLWPALEPELAYHAGLYRTWDERLEATMERLLDAYGIEPLSVPEPVARWLSASPTAARGVARLLGAGVFPPGWDDDPPGQLVPV